MSPFLFNLSQSKADAVVNQMGHPCFCKSSTVSELNLKAATAVKEKQYTMSNITYIKF